MSKKPRRFIVCSFNLAIKVNF